MGWLTFVLVVAVAVTGGAFVIVSTIDRTPDERSTLTSPSGDMAEATPREEPGPALLGRLLPEGTLALETAEGVQVTSAGAATQTMNLAPLDLARDGSAILASDGPALMSVDVDSGEETTLFRARPSRAVHLGIWSPDHSRVAFTLVPDEGTQTTLCVLHHPFGRTRCFPQLGRIYDLHWSSSSTEHLLVAGHPTEPIHLVDTHTGEIRDLFPQQGNTALNEALARAGLGRSFQLVGPRFSPSGRYVAGLANLDDSRFVYIPVILTRGGKPVAFGRPSTEFPEPMEWSPVDDVLAYTQGRAPYRITELHVLDPRTGRDDLVLTANGQPYPQIMDIAWAPTGRWLLAALWQPNGPDQQIERLLIINPGTPERPHHTRYDSGGISRPLVGWAR